MAQTGKSGITPQAGPPGGGLDNRGLDFSNLQSITPQEIEAFRASYQTEDGNPQSGFDYLIEHNPGALKSYRQMATQFSPPFRDPRYACHGWGWFSYYGYLDYDEGVRYSIVPMVRSGITEAQIHEGTSISFLLGGTRALVCYGRVLNSFNWPTELPETAPWPEDWEVDPTAFRSGVDFSTVEVLPGELSMILDWYRNTIGWIPTSIRYLAAHNPRQLKSYRYRYENALVTLPKQVMPLSLLAGGALFGYREVIRENVLLARAFGLTLEDVRLAINLTHVYGTEFLAIAYEAAGDLLDHWD